MEGCLQYACCSAPGGLVSGLSYISTPKSAPALSHMPHWPLIESRFSSCLTGRGQCWWSVGAPSCRPSCRLKLTPIISNRMSAAGLSDYSWYCFMLSRYGDRRCVRRRPRLVVRLSPMCCLPCVLVGCEWFASSCAECGYTIQLVFMYVLSQQVSACASQYIHCEFHSHH